MQKTDKPSIDTGSRILGNCVTVD